MVKNDLLQIDFTYSSIYDRILQGLIMKDFNVKKNRELYSNFMKRFEKHWTSSKQRKALNLISKCTGLPWKSEQVIVYLVNDIEGLNGFSHPLTIKIQKDPLLFCLFLIHELTHIIFSDNRKKFKQVVSKLEKDFPDEDEVTINHLIVNAVERRVFEGIYGKKRYSNYLIYLKKFRRNGKAYRLLDNFYLSLGDDILQSLKSQKLKP